MNRDAVLLAGVALLSVIAGAAVFMLTSTPPAVVSAGPGGREIPTLNYASLAFADLDGNRRTLGEWNKPLQVINLWAPWCAPCRREIPALIKLQSRYAEQVQFIGIAYDSRENVVAFSDSFDFNYPLLLVQQSFSALNQYFGNHSGGLPFTVIIDAQRNIVFQHTGEISEQQLEQQISTLL